MIDLRTAFAFSVGALIIGALAYVQRLRNELKNKRGELAQSKVDGEIKVNEERVNEATRRALSSLEHYRKLRDRNTKKP